MCNYIKDNGEQCGRDAEPFCHQHNETIQAVQYELQQVRNDFGEALLDDAGEVSRGIEMDATCDECEAPLRRTERLTEAENRPTRVFFEAVVECDCSEHVLGTHGELRDKLPWGL